jgi:hypothetical protein
MTGTAVSRSSGLEESGRHDENPDRALDAIAHGEVTPHEGTGGDVPWMESGRLNRRHRPGRPSAAASGKRAGTRKLQPQGTQPSSRKLQAGEPQCSDWVGQLPAQRNPGAQHPARPRAARADSIVTLEVRSLTVEATRSRHAARSPRDPGGKHVRVDTARRRQLACRTHHDRPPNRRSWSPDRLARCLEPCCLRRQDNQRAPR